MNLDDPLHWHRISWQTWCRCLSILFQKKWNTSSIYFIICIVSALWNADEWSWFVNVSPKNATYNVFSHNYFLWLGVYYNLFIFSLSGNAKAIWREIFEKYSVLQLKLLADLLENHPFSFLKVMKETLNVVCRLCFTNEGEGLLFQRFIIISFNIIKQVLLCPEFKMPKQINDDGI